MVNKFIDVDCHIGLDLQYMQMHSETHGEFDPFASMPLFDVGQVVSPPELMPHDDDCEGRCCQELARPQGRGDIAGALLERPGGRREFLSVVRSAATGMVDNESALVHHEMHQRRSLVVPL